MLKWSVFLQTQHNITFFLNKLPAGDPELIWNHPSKQSRSGRATVPLHKRPRQPNLSAVPNFCNAATHSTRLREREHERGSLSGKERPCSAALRMRTTTAHYLAGCGRCRWRKPSTILPFTVNAGSVFRKSCVTDTQASAQKQLASIYNNTRVLQWMWQCTLP